MYSLFTDKDVIAYIEGIQWFNADVEAVVRFIDSMKTNFQRKMGMLWSVIYNDVPVGIIMVNDLKEKPFLTFALFPEYRGLRIGTEIYESIYRFISANYRSPRTETKNPIVKKILRHSADSQFHIPTFTDGGKILCE